MIKSKRICNKTDNIPPIDPFLPEGDSLSPDELTDYLVKTGICSNPLKKEKKVQKLLKNMSRSEKIDFISENGKEKFYEFLQREIEEGLRERARARLNQPKSRTYFA